MQANIESEDWARRYKFDQVIWPHVQDTTTKDDPALMKLAFSMGNDAVFRHEGSICLGVGGTNSGKSETMFGSTKNGDHGLLGMVVDTVFANLSEHAVCTLSLLNIVDEKVLRDLLVGSNENPLKIRHLGTKGAVVQGLSDMPLDSMTGLDVSIG